MDLDSQPNIEPSPTSSKSQILDTEQQPESEEKSTEHANPLNDITIWKGKWNKKEYAVYFDHLTSIADLKEQLEDETNDRKEKIKLVGLKYKKEFKNTSNKITDTSLVHHLQCKSKKGFIMIGTLDKNAFKVMLQNILSSYSLTHTNLHRILI